MGKTTEKSRNLAQRICNLPVNQQIEAICYVIDKLGEKKEPKEPNNQ